MSTDWAVYDYEASMYVDLLDLCAKGQHKLHPHPVPNAIVESLLLHTRILVDILLSRDGEPDAVHLSKLLPGFDSPEIGALRKVYGSTKDSGSPCGIINKRLAHATTIRSDNFDYTALANALGDLLSPIIKSVQNERTDRTASVKPKSRDFD
jgi:hypothetical protein